jgi:ubiquitin-protein ligase
MTARPKNRLADILFQELHNLKGGVRPHAKWHCLDEHGGARWLGGSYLASFPADHSGTTTIRVQISDHDHHDHHFSWSISTPQSLWYPGTHSGTMTLPSDFPSTPPKIHFSTHIFSPHVDPEGVIGPGITHGETWGSEVTILDILHDIAAMLVVSPICRWDTVLYRLLPRLRPHNVLKWDVMAFFNKDKEAFLRATNFFSRAFAQDEHVPEANREVTADDVEGTVLTITELIGHFENGRSRVLPHGFSKSNVRHMFERVHTLQEFRSEEKRWARALQTICHSR